MGIAVGVVCNMKEGPMSAPETDVSLFLHRDSETFTILGIDDSPILLDHIGTEDILHTYFLHFGVCHTLHPLSALASHCCPMTGLSHLTRVQLKTQSCMEPWACLFPMRRRTESDGQSLKGGGYDHQNALQIYDIIINSSSI